MHFCENPLDVLEFYPLIDNNGEMNDFAEVEALDDAKGDGKKFVSSKLRIGAKLSLPGFVKACVGFMIEKTAADAKGDCKASGDSSQLAASGDSSQLAANGKYSVVAGIGVDNMAKAKKGCWITLAEWEWSDKENANIPVCVKTESVDGERIKEDVFYKLENGEFVEVNE